MARTPAPTRRDPPDIQWLERMYNNRMRVPDHADYYARWAAESALVRRSLPCDLDVAYGTAPGETLDVFPAARPGAPVVVFIHGGYWRASTAQDYSSVALGLQPLGITTVVLNYALCPQVRLDEIVRQVRAGLAWVYTPYAESRPQLVALQRQARSSGTGLWSQKRPLAPWTYRHRHSQR